MDASAPPDSASASAAQADGGGTLSTAVRDGADSSKKAKKDDRSVKAGTDKDELSRLEKSSLWQEDIHVGGHHSVWGSWYDVEAKSWGYSCCRGTDIGRPCTDPKQTAPKKRRHHKAFDYEQAFDWSNPPTALMPYDKVMLTAELLNRKEGAFVSHFIRFAVGTWRRLLEGGKKEEEDFSKEIPVDFRKVQSLEETQEGIVPLMRQIQKNETDPKIIRHIDKVVSLAAEREYSQARLAYVDATMGRKKWNNVIASYGGTHCQNKGFRIYITKCDDLNEYDQDPVLEKIYHSISKLVRLVEVIYPNTDTSKRFSETVP
jgi:hypothetical protein